MDGGFWINILVGVVSTVLVSVLMYLGRGMLGRLLALIPGLESRSVRGTWDTKWRRGQTEHTEVVKLNQFLHYVWGTVEYTPFDGKPMTYKLHGVIKQDVFVATYEIKSEPASLDIGSFTVRISDGLGQTMKGKYSWPDDQTLEVISGDYKWRKRVVEDREQEVEW